MNMNGREPGIKEIVIICLALIGIVIGVGTYIADALNRKEKEDEKEYLEKKCLVYECENPKAEGSYYCSEHKCKFQNCARMKEYDSLYCGYHAWQYDSEYRLNHEHDYDLPTGPAEDNDRKRKDGIEGKGSSGYTKKPSGPDDPYDVYDFDDAEDFADEWEEEFDDWDDAYEYWYENS